MKVEVNEAEIATIFAALRFYQSKGMGEPTFREEGIHQIATDHGRIQSSLDSKEIDELCERLNAEVAS